MEMWRTDKKCMYDDIDDNGCCDQMIGDWRLKVSGATRVPAHIHYPSRVALKDKY